MESMMEEQHPTDSQFDFEEHQEAELGFELHPLDESHILLDSNLRRDVHWDANFTQQEDSEVPFQSNSKHDSPSLVAEAAAKEVKSQTWEMDEGLFHEAVSEEVNDAFESQGDADQVHHTETEIPMGFFMEQDEASAWITLSGKDDHLQPHSNPSEVKGDNICVEGMEIPKEAGASHKEECVGSKETIDEFQDFRLHSSDHVKTISSLAGEEKCCPAESLENIGRGKLQADMCSHEESALSVGTDVRSQVRESDCKEIQLRISDIESAGIKGEEVIRDAPLNTSSERESKDCHAEGLVPDASRSIISTDSSVKESMDLGVENEIYGSEVQLGHFADVDRKSVAMPREETCKESEMSGCQLSCDSQHSKESDDSNERQTYGNTLLIAGNVRESYISDPTEQNQHEMQRPAEEIVDDDDELSDVHDYLQANAVKNAMVVGKLDASNGDQIKFPEQAVMQEEKNQDELLSKSVNTPSENSRIESDAIPRYNRDDTESENFKLNNSQSEGKPGIGDDVAFQEKECSVTVIHTELQVTNVEICLVGLDSSAEKVLTDEQNKLSLVETDSEVEDAANNRLGILSHTEIEFANVELCSAGLDSSVEIFLPNEQNQLSLVKNDSEVEVNERFDLSKNESFCMFSHNREAMDVETTLQEDANLEGENYGVEEQQEGGESGGDEMEIETGSQDNLKSDEKNKEILEEHDLEDSLRGNNDQATLTTYEGFRALSKGEFPQVSNLVDPDIVRREIAVPTEDKLGTSETTSMVMKEVDVDNTEDKMEISDPCEEVEVDNAEVEMEISDRLQMVVKEVELDNTEDEMEMCDPPEMVMKEVEVDNTEDKLEISGPPTIVTKEVEVDETEDKLETSEPPAIVMEKGEVENAEDKLETLELPGMTMKEAEVANTEPKLEISFPPATAMKENEIENTEDKLEISDPPGMVVKEVELDNAEDKMEVCDPPEIVMKEVEVDNTEDRLEISEPPTIVTKEVEVDNTEDKLETSEPPGIVMKEREVANAEDKLETLESLGMIMKEAEVANSEHKREISDPLAMTMKETEIENTEDTLEISYPPAVVTKESEVENTADKLEITDSSATVMKETEVENTEVKLEISDPLAMVMEETEVENTEDKLEMTDPLAMFRKETEVDNTEGDLEITAAAAMITKEAEVENTADKSEITAPLAMVMKEAELENTEDKLEITDPLAMVMKEAELENTEDKLEITDPLAMGMEEAEVENTEDKLEMTDPPAMVMKETEVENTEGELEIIAPAAMVMKEAKVENTEDKLEISDPLAMVTKEAELENTEDKLEIADPLAMVREETEVEHTEDKLEMTDPLAMVMKETEVENTEGELEITAAAAMVMKEAELENTEDKMEITDPLAMAMKEAEVENTEDKLEITAALATVTKETEGKNTEDKLEMAVTPATVMKEIEVENTEDKSEITATPVIVLKEAEVENTEDKLEIIDPLDTEAGNTVGKVEITNPLAMVMKETEVEYKKGILKITTTAMAIKEAEVENTEDKLEITDPPGTEVQNTADKLEVTDTLSMVMKETEVENTEDKLERTPAMVMKEAEVTEDKLEMTNPLAMVMKETEVENTEDKLETSEPPDMVMEEVEVEKAEDRLEISEPPAKGMKEAEVDNTEDKLEISEPPPPLKMEQDEVDNKLLENHTLHSNESHHSDLMVPEILPSKEMLSLQTFDASKDGHAALLQELDEHRSGDNLQEQGGDQALTLKGSGEAKSQTTLFNPGNVSVFLPHSENVNHFIEESKSQGDAEAMDNISVATDSDATHMGRELGVETEKVHFNERESVHKGSINVCAASEVSENRTEANSHNSGDRSSVEMPQNKNSHSSADSDICFGESFNNQTASLELKNSEMDYGEGYAQMQPLKNRSDDLRKAMIQGGENIALDANLENKSNYQDSPAIDTGADKQDNQSKKQGHGTGMMLGCKEFCKQHEEHIDKKEADDVASVDQKTELKEIDGPGPKPMKEVNLLTKAADAVSSLVCSNEVVEVSESSHHEGLQNDAVSMVACESSKTQVSVSHNLHDEDACDIKAQPSDKMVDISINFHTLNATCSSTAEVNTLMKYNDKKQEAAVEMAFDTETSVDAMEPESGAGHADNVVLDNITRDCTKMAVATKDSPSPARATNCEVTDGAEKNITSKTHAGNGGGDLIGAERVPLEKKSSEINKGEKKAQVEAEELDHVLSLSHGSIKYTSGSHTNFGSQLEKRKTQLVFGQSSSDEATRRKAVKESFEPSGSPRIDLTVEEGASGAKPTIHISGRKQSRRGKKSRERGDSHGVFRDDYMSPIGSRYQSTVPESNVAEATATTTTPVPVLKSPFMHQQEVQLRAQILVYGSLIQGLVPEEALMMTAFADTIGVSRQVSSGASAKEVGRVSWEESWHRAVERLRYISSSLVNTKESKQYPAAVQQNQPILLEGGTSSTPKENSRTISVVSSVAQEASNVITVDTRSPVHTATTHSSDMPKSHTPTSSRRGKGKSSVAGRVTGASALTQPPSSVAGRVTGVSALTHPPSSVAEMLTGVSTLTHPPSSVAGRVTGVSALTHLPSSVAERVTGVSALTHPPGSVAGRVTGVSTLTHPPISVAGRVTGVSALTHPPSSVAGRVTGVSDLTHPPSSVAGRVTGVSALTHPPSMITYSWPQPTLGETIQFSQGTGPPFRMTFLAPQPAPFIPSVNSVQWPLGTPLIPQPLSTGTDPSIQSFMKTTPHDSLIPRRPPLPLHRTSQSPSSITVESELLQKAPAKQMTESRPRKRRKSQAETQTARTEHDAGSNVLIHTTASPNATYLPSPPSLAMVAVSKSASEFPPVTTCSTKMPVDISDSAPNVTITYASQHRVVPTSSLNHSTETLKHLEEAKHNADEADLLATRVIMQSEAIWAQMQSEKALGLCSNKGSNLASAAVAISAAASVAKAAAAAARVAYKAALQAKLMGEEVAASNSMSSQVHIPTIACSAFGSENRSLNPCDSIVSNANELATERVETTSAATLRVDNIEAVFRAAELAAAAISKIGAVVSMGDPIPFTLDMLLDAGQDGLENLGTGNITSSLDRREQQMYRIESKQGDSGVMEEICNSKTGVLLQRSEKVREAEECKIVDSEKNTKAGDGSLELVDNGIQSLAPDETSLPIKEKMLQEAAFTGPINLDIAKQKPSMDGTTLDPEVADPNQIKKGSTVEVLSNEEGLCDAWFSGRVLNIEGGKALVLYDELLSNDGLEKLEEWVDLETLTDVPPRIRLAHPITRINFEGTRKRRRAAMGNYNWSSGDRVDAWIRDGWQEGQVLEKIDEDGTNLKIFFPGGSNTLLIKSWNLRPSLIWKGGVWVLWTNIKSKIDNAEADVPPLGETPLGKRQKIKEFEAADAGHVQGTHTESESLGCQIPPEISMEFQGEKSYHGNNDKTNKELGLLKLDKQDKKGSENVNSQVIVGIAKQAKKRKYLEVNKQDSAIDKGPRESRSNLSRDRGAKNAVEDDSKLRRKPQKPVQDKVCEEARHTRGWAKVSAHKYNKVPDSATSSRKELHGQGPAVASLKPSRTVSSVNGQSSETHKSQIRTAKFSKKPDVRNSDNMQKGGPNYRIPSNKRELASIGTRSFGKDKLAVNSSKDVEERVDRFSSTQEAIEIRKSNRRIQPTSKLLEGLESSPRLGKGSPSLSHFIKGLFPT